MHECVRDCSVPCVYLMGANVTLPKWVSAHDVPEVPASAAPHCSQVQCSLLAMDAWVPSVHASYRRPGVEQSTFHMRVTGVWSTIDYIAVSPTIWVTPASGQALVDFDMFCETADHRPTALVIRIPVCSSDRPRPRRRPAYSRQALLDAIVNPSDGNFAARDAF